jgi:hypothetical protein
VHGLGLEEPFEGEDEKLTEPVGVLAVPPSVSVTVAVHVVPTATSTELAAHEIEVLVERVVTLMLAGEAVLVAWAPSPP